LPVSLFLAVIPSSSRLSIDLNIALRLTVDLLAHCRTHPGLQHQAPCLPTQPRLQLHATCCLTYSTPPLSRDASRPSWLLFSAMLPAAR